MKRKTILLNFNPLFFPSIENRLANMAKRGWILEEINEYSMIFKFSESQNLVFGTLVQSKQNPSKYDDSLNEAEMMCREDGWELRARFRNFSVFSNVNLNATPIHTDSSHRYQTILDNTVLAVSIFGVLLLILLFFGRPVNGLETYLWFEPVIASYVIILYIFAAIGVITLAPAITWLAMNRDKLEIPKFEFPDFLVGYQTKLLFILYCLPSILILSYPFLMQKRNLSTGVYLFGFIGVAIVFSVSKWKRFIQGKRGMTIESTIFAIILFVMTGLLSVGGDRFIQSFIFQPDRYLKMADFDFESADVNAYDSASVGLLGFEKVNYIESGEQGSIMTQIMVFYTKRHKEKYWDTLRRDYQFDTAIIVDQQFIGYYLKENRGVLLRNGNEIVLIISTFDLSEFGRLQTILERLKITPR